METAPSTPATPPATPPDSAPTPLRVPFTPEQLLPVIGEPLRFRILAILIDGNGHSATELGRAIGKGREATAKHCATLRTAGLVEICDNRADRRTTCYRLAAPFRPAAPGAPRELDFGWCLLRFGG